MKKINLISAALLIASVTVKAQQTEPKLPNGSDVVVLKVDSNAIFTAVEKVPEFPGGLEQFYKFLQHNIRYPAVAFENKVQGKVFVTFVVEKDGSLTNIKEVHGIGNGCDEEAVRVMKISPKWNPGTQNGRAVRVLYTMPISFTLIGR